MLSIDTFHEEHIPLKFVLPFVKALKNIGIEDFKLHPAWVVNENHNNIYNEQTKKCLNYFEEFNLPISKGNNIFLSGNAYKNLSSYYEKKSVDISMKCGDIPYTQRPDLVTNLSVNPNGDIDICGMFITNINNDDFLKELDAYNPYANEKMKIVLDNGVIALLETENKKGRSFDLSKYHSMCDLCKDLRRQ